MTGIRTVDVASITLSELAEAIAGGHLTPSEALEAYLERLDAVEGRVQAWSHLDLAGVRAAAAALTAESAAGRLRGPLHGVPFAAKDEFHVAGMPTYFADPDGRPQQATATPIERMRAAGAVLVGKTHMPVGGVMPPTRNPWNLAHTAGGTSSGSGAAVAARMVPFALGEQTAGSNLRPAAYCGVAGLKPTFGRVSRFGCYQFSYSHDHVGLIGLTMADLALVLSVVAGPDPKDRTARAEAPPPAQLSIEEMRPPQIGVVRTFFPERTTPVMLDAIERSAERLRDAGATLVDVALPADFGLVWMVHRLINATEAFTLHSRKYAEPGSPPPLRDRIAALIPTSYYLQAQRIRHHLWQELQELFEQTDALLMAAAPGAAPAGTASTGDASLLVPWSCVGFPAITINGGLSPEGLPLGLQLVRPPMTDHTLLRIGAWCEQILGRLPAPVVN